MPAFSRLFEAGSRLLKSVLKILKSRQKVLWHIQHSVTFVLASLLTIPIDRLIEWVYRYKTIVLDVFLSTRVKSYSVPNSRLLDQNRAKPAVWASVTFYWKILRR